MCYRLTVAHQRRKRKRPVCRGVPLIWCCNPVERGGGPRRWPRGRLPWPLVVRSLPVAGSSSKMVYCVQVTACTKPPQAKLFWRQVMMPCPALPRIGRAPFGWLSTPLMDGWDADPARSSRVHALLSRGSEVQCQGGISPEILRLLPGCGTNPRGTWNNSTDFSAFMVFYRTLAGKIGEPSTCVESTDL